MTLKATPKARRLLATILSVVAAVMVVGAVGLLGYPEYTNIRAENKQKVLRAELENASSKLKAAYENPVKTGSASGQATLAEGSPLTKIQIPKIGLDTIVVQGTSSQALAAGTGHYPQTPLPCANTGNVAIAGHRTMNGHPFQDLNKMATGDTITLQTPFQECTYTVVKSVDGHDGVWTTLPNDWTVIAQTTSPFLTLTTCTPEGTASQRIVVRASLTSVKNIVPGAVTK